MRPFSYTHLDVYKRQAETFRDTFEPGNVYIEIQEHGITTDSGITDEELSRTLIQIAEQVGVCLLYTSTGFPDAEHGGTMGFDELLDRVEQVIARKLDALEAVSYTHLDVYKRQGHIYSFARCR